LDGLGDGGVVGAFGEGVGGEEGFVIAAYGDGISTATILIQCFDVPMPWQATSPLAMAFMAAQSLAPTTWPMLPCSVEPRAMMKLTLLPWPFCNSLDVTPCLLSKAGAALTRPERSRAEMVDVLMMTDVQRNGSDPAQQRVDI